MGEGTGGGGGSQEATAENRQKNPFDYDHAEPAEYPVALKGLLPQIENTITQHVVIDQDAAKALAVWVVHTYVFEQREAVAYVAIQSPEKRCGKTILLSVLAGMAAKPLLASNISVGALFRAIDEAHPTLLIDEADTFLGRNSAMRGILNSGNTRRTAFVLRLARRQESHPAAQTEADPTGRSNVVRFSCWCPKAIAMIGRVPETLADRAIVVNMQRKLVAEKCAPLAEFRPKEIQRQCKRWAQDYATEVKNWPRVMLEEINDRASDTFEPLMVLGEMAGKEAAEQLKNAAIKLCGHANTEPEAAGLLLDIMTVFIFRRASRVFSRDLAQALKGKIGWIAYDATSRGTVTELSIAQTLRKYSIRPTTVRIGNDVSKGYKWEDFREALDHYVPKAEIEHKIQELHEMNDLALEAQQAKQKEEAQKEAARQQEFINEEAEQGRDAGQPETEDQQQEQEAETHETTRPEAHKDANKEPEGKEVPEGDATKLEGPLRLADTIGQMRKAMQQQRPAQQPRQEAGAGGEKREGRQPDSPAPPPEP